MLHITQVGRVMVPVADQDQAIAFYTSKLGFSLVADVPYGEGDRWVEVAPPGGGTALALVPPRGDYAPGRMAAGWQKPSGSLAKWIGNGYSLPPDDCIRR